MGGEGATEVETVLKLLHALGDDLTVTQGPHFTRTRKEISSQSILKKRLRLGSA